MDSSKRDFLGKEIPLEIFVKKNGLLKEFIYHIKSSSNIDKLASKLGFSKVKYVLPNQLEPLDLNKYDVVLYIGLRKETSEFDNTVTGFIERVK